MNVQDIKIKDIVITQNSRVDMKDLAELMESIKQHGLLHPIHVGKGAGNKYIFESGRRRLMACEKLGYQTIPAIVSEEKKYKDLIIANLIENVQRKDLTVAELGRICTELRDQSMNAKEISVVLGIALSKVETALSTYAHVPIRFRKKVTFLDKRNNTRKGQISASAANSIIGIRRRHKMKAEDIDTIFEAAVDENLSQADIKNLSSLINSGLTVNQALKEKDKYKDYSVIVTVDEDTVLDLAKRYKVYPTAAIQMIVYGEIKETLKRPKFIKA